MSKNLKYEPSEMKRIIKIADELSKSDQTLIHKKQLTLEHKFRLIWLFFMHIPSWFSWGSRMEQFYEGDFGELSKEETIAKLWQELKTSFSINWKGSNFEECL